MKFSLKSLFLLTFWAALGFAVIGFVVRIEDPATRGVAALVLGILAVFVTGIFALIGGLQLWAWLMLRHLQSDSIRRSAVSSAAGLAGALFGWMMMLFFALDRLNRGEPWMALVFIFAGPIAIWTSAAQAWRDWRRFREAQEK